MPMWSAISHRAIRFWPSSTLAPVAAAQPGLDPTILGRLPSKTIIYGVLDLKAAPEAPERVADRIRAALHHVPAERLVVAPDCGMKYLPGDVAAAKLDAMVKGAAFVRQELAA